MPTASAIQKKKEVSREIRKKSWNAGSRLLCSIFFTVQWMYKWCVYLVALKWDCVGWCGRLGHLTAFEEPVVASIPVCWDWTGFYDPLPDDLYIQDLYQAEPQYRGSFIFQSRPHPCLCVISLCPITQIQKESTVHILLEDTNMIWWDAWFLMGSPWWRWYVLLIPVSHSSWDVKLKFKCEITSAPLAIDREVYVLFMFIGTKSSSR